MKLTILDGYALNPGDLSWEYLNRYGEVMVYDRTPSTEIVERAKEADVVLTNKVPLDTDTLKQLPKLKYIGVLATGYNIIDINQANRQGIVVTNVPGYSTRSVAQLTFALLLELCHHVQYHSDRVMEGKWAQSPDFSFWDYPLIELSEKTIGIVGFGDIGGQVADIATAFGMQVMAYSRTETDQSHRSNFRWVGLDELLAHSDVVSLHCPLTPQTNGMMNKDTLAKMKPSAFLINTSRGPLVVEKDLKELLNRGKIAGAGLDVLSVEPPDPDNPLFGAKNCLITPHIAWATQEARSRLMEIADANLSAYLAGKPVNVVN
ncbi:glycerate dehydrogenase [Parapedobacter pyrenivorans]|uniref:Glycerate dehydrogenase n=1 Tax=Parapedobacter pyrenivorans TaxID=1305674 RepID=A0A917HL82_9SPHI|nr:D-2-hydroxyacid dehydrogenase [Parapedobacter pyrenivorans]GGG83264.1 glycerate dehydrogenase [Parapedobacter pyrenivorans]